jgi:hypothetical protein
MARLMTKGEASASSAPTMPFMHKNRGQVGPVFLLICVCWYGINDLVFPLGLLGEIGLRLLGAFSIFISFVYL